MPHSGRLEDVMKRMRGFRFICFLIIIIMILTACGKKSNELNYAPEENLGLTYGKGDAPTTDDGDNFAGNEPDSKGEVGNDTGSSEEGTGTGVKTASVGTTSTQNKIIYKFVLDIETQNFDKLLEDTQNTITDLGGYVETSKVGGKSYYDNNVERTGYIVARVPSNKANEFLLSLKKSSNANVIKSEQSSENVSLQYVDAQSRVETLKIEQERLYDILKNAKELESIITLETRLSDIRYELEKYQSQLRLYDNQVEYSFVTLNFQEVKRISPSEEEKPTFFSRISDGLTTTFDDVSNGFQSFCIWFVVNLPYFIIWGVILLIAFLITRKTIRGHKKKLYMPSQNPTINQANPNHQTPTHQEGNNQDHNN